MKDGDAWMPWWIGDYLGDTMRLSTLQHGAYFLLTLDYWRRGPPPDDPEQLASITKMTPEEWARHSSPILELFELRAHRWVHHRIDLERARAVVNVTAKSEGGKKGAARRWEKQQAAAALAAGARAGVPAPPAAPSPAAPVEARTDGNPNGSPDGPPNGVAIAVANAIAMAARCPSPSPSPSSSNEDSLGGADVARVPARAREDLLEAVHALHEAGIDGVSTDDPRLAKLLELGTTCDELREVASTAVARDDVRSKFKWMCVVLESRREEAAAMTARAPPAVDWRQSQKTVVARAEALGMPAWEDYREALMRSGTTPHWSTYRAEVIQADQAAALARDEEETRP
jgi:uncharacterized protein YdaU (DUF1376 family)